VSRFKAGCWRSKRIKLFAVMRPQRGGAGGRARAGVKTQVVIFGSPAAGRRLWRPCRSRALDLPLKVLVVADEDQARVSYARPASLAARLRLGADLRRAD